MVYNSPQSSGSAVQEVLDCQRRVELRHGALRGVVCRLQALPEPDEQRGPLSGQHRPLPAPAPRLPPGHLPAHGGLLVRVCREGGREEGERVVLFLLLIPGRVWLDRAVSMLPALKGTLCSAKTGFVANKAERLSLPNTLIFQFHCAIYSTEVAVCWAGYV